MQKIKHIPMKTKSIHKKTRVALALSGGVDSAVAAFLLKKKGFDVVGIFMKNYESPKNVLDACTWKADQDSAQRVAQHLNIPFQTWNFEREYSTKVLKPFFRDLEKGKTPNPDILCNKHIKFGMFLSKALALNFDFIATGHYAKIQKKGNHYFLIKPKDTTKDQTYFLSSVKEKQLSKTLFPLADYTKTQIRALAKDISLPNAKRPDSQGICFVGEVPMKEFLKGKVTAQPGPILNINGERVGTHQGLPYYTIGQRDGLGIGGLQNPYYVAQKNVRKNVLVVDTFQSKHTALLSEAILVKPIHWISASYALPLHCRVSFRYRQKPQSATILKRKGKIVILPTRPQRAITPGQNAVIYKNSICLGNAEIVRQL